MFRIRTILKTMKSKEELENEKTMIEKIEANLPLKRFNIKF